MPLGTGKAEAPAAFRPPGRGRKWTPPLRDKGDGSVEKAYAVGQAGSGRSPVRRPAAAVRGGAGETGRRRRPPPEGGMSAFGRDGYDAYIGRYADAPGR